MGRGRKRTRETVTPVTAQHCAWRKHTQMQTAVPYADLPEYDLLESEDGQVVEVKRPRERVRPGRFIHECQFCGYSGRAERGRQPRPSNRPAQFCPACRGGIR